jgi:hypothetical protein
MKRTAIVSLLWVLTIALTAGIAYWMGRQETRTFRSQPHPEIAQPLTESQRQVLLPPDLEIVQPLTESQRQVLLRTPSVSVTEGMTVTVSEPGKPLQRFMAQGKLDLPDKPPKDPSPSPSLNNPFKDDKPSKGPELPDYVPYPCRVRDSRGESVWGVCFRRKF